MFKEYKKIRNKIRKFNPIEVVAKGCIILNDPDYAQIEKMKLYPPWLVMLLIEWALLEIGNEHYHKRQITDRDFNKLINMVKSFDGKQVMPSNHDNILLFIRKMAFQQFELQKTLNRGDLGRQILLLHSLPRTPYFQETFFAITGLELFLFFGLAVVLSTAYLLDRQKLFIEKNYFEPLLKSLDREALDNFFASLSLTPIEAKEFLKENDWIRQSLQHQLFAETPMKIYPLLNFAGKYMPYSRALLFYSIQNFAYELLRQHDPHRFMVNFSPVFQTYVGNCLEYAGLKYMDERELAGIIGSGNKVVDFLVIDEGINVFIEAKAIEMTALAKVTHSRKIIAERTKTHLVKAIAQGVSTISKINEANCGVEVSDPQKNYLLIATYKDMYVGNGRDYYAYIAREKIDKILSNCKSGNILLPMEHIYTVSAEELDLIVGHIRAGTANLRSLLETAVENDSSYATSKFLLSQHLPVIDTGSPLPTYLEESVGLVFNYIGAMLKEADCLCSR